MPPDTKAAPLTTGPLNQIHGTGSVAPTIRDTAVKLAERGFAVFPCGTPGGGSHGHVAGPDKDCSRCKGEKAPARGWKWKERNSADPAVIAAHWPQDGPNIGVACHASGLVVVDLDTPSHGGVMPDEWTAKGGIREGADVFAYLVEQQGEQWPETLSVRTASGGTHLYFRAIPGRPIPNSAGKVGPMVDVRGDGNADGTAGGGYVVGPGSTVGGVRYRLVGASAPVLPVPEWLVETLRTRPAPPARRTARPVCERAAGTGGRPYRVLTGIVGRVLDATPHADRNHLVFWAGCRIYEHAARGLFDEHAARAAVLDAARRIGLGDDEANRSLDSAKKTIRGTR